MIHRVSSPLRSTRRANNLMTFSQRCRGRALAALLLTPTRWWRDLDVNPPRRLPASSRRWLRMSGRSHREVCSTSMISSCDAPTTLSATRHMPKLFVGASGISMSTRHKTSRRSSSVCSQPCGPPAPTTSLSLVTLRSRFTASMAATPNCLCKLTTASLAWRSFDYR